MKTRRLGKRVWMLAAIILFAGVFCSCVSPSFTVPNLAPTTQLVVVKTAVPFQTETCQPTAILLPSFAPTLTPASTITATYPASIRQRPYTVILTETTGGGSQQVTLHALLFLPVEYENDPTRRWPLILFLHGSGEAGTDLYRLKRVMLPKYLEDHPDFPFIVVSPQIPAPGSQSLTIPYDPEQYMETYGWNPWIERLELLLDAVQTGYRVDQGRVYLTGLSMGGFGVWNYALRYPARFAAIVPIAGGYRFYERTIPDNICDLKDLPVWAFHGGQDTTVPPWQSQILVDALTACGGKPLLTVYPDAGHDAWSQAYSDPDLYTWLLEKKK